MFPAGFDADGHLFCNTSFGDYPTKLPSGRWDPWQDPFPGWMLLSYKKPVTASSSLPGHASTLAVNENIRDYWSAASGAPGEWLQVDLGSVCTVQAVQINFAEEGCAQYAREGEPLRHRYLLESSADGRVWSSAVDKRLNEADVPHDYVEWARPLTARFFRITNEQTPAAGKFAISGLRIFGKGTGPTPGAVTAVDAVMAKDDPLTATLAWNAVPGAMGYNVRWGIAPNKLYHSWLVYERNELTLRALNKGNNYWVRVDAFNENGVTTGATAPIGKSE